MVYNIDKILTQSTQNLIKAAIIQSQINGTIILLIMVYPVASYGTYIRFNTSIESTDINIRVSLLLFGFHYLYSQCLLGNDVLALVTYAK